MGIEREEKERKGTSSFFIQNGKIYLLLCGLNIPVNNIQVEEGPPGMP
jgi:hypothetical protein